MTHNAKILLAPERRRRILLLVGIVATALVYFYEYPLYGLLAVYSRYQGWSGLEPVPGLTGIDWIFLFGCVAAAVFVWLRPRHFLRSRDGGLSFDLYRRGALVETIARSDLSTLVITFDHVRRSPSRDSGFITSIKIYCDSKPEIVFYDSVPSRLWWYEKRLSRKLQRQLGDGIEWKDKHGILSGREDPSRTERVRKRERQMEDIAARSRRTPPKVVKAYGSRTFLVAVFGGFGAAFWYPGYAIVAYVFWGLSAIILIDMVLAMMGVGQQPEKK